MILVDTTVWVDYFNGVNNLYTRYFDRLLDQESILLGDIILGEILQGFREDTEFESARRALAVFEVDQILTPDRAMLSANNFRMLRKRGITVRKTIDCMIATYCIDVGMPLLHNDRDFDPFELHLGLTVIHP